MTQLISNINETRQWAKDFIEVKMIVLRKKPKATKRSDHRTISLTAHTAVIVGRILRRRTERKIEGVLEKDQFWFEQEKGTRGKIGMLRMISESNLDINEKLCV
jgi:hypothetical protein